MIRRNLIANYMGQGWSTLMALAFIPLYIRYLGVEAYGVIGLYILVQAWLYLLDMGMKPALSREMARFTGGAKGAISVRNLLRTIEVISLSVAVIMVLLGFCFSDWLAADWINNSSLSNDEVSRALIIIACVSALQFIETIYSSVLIGLQQQVIQNIITAMMATLRGGGAVLVLMFYSSTLEAFFVWNLIISFVSIFCFVFVVYFLLPKIKVRARFSFEEVAGVWRFASGMFFITLLSLILTQVDKLMLSKFVSLKDFGYYALAARVVYVLNVFTSPVVSAFYPRFVELVASESNKELVHKYHTAAQLLSVLVGSIAIVMILFGDLLIFSWTGDLSLTEHVVPIISVLGIGSLFNRMLSVPYRMQLAYGWTSLSIKMNLFAVVVAVPSLYFTIPTYGSMGAAYVWASVSLASFIGNVFFMYRKILVGEAVRWYFNDVFLPIFFGIIAAVLFKFVQPFDLNRLISAGYLLVALFFVFALSALGASIIRQLIYKELDMLFRKLVGP